MGALDDLPHLRMLALRNVLVGGDEDYLLRKFFRSYSRTFSTALHLVETLPIEDVLLNYFENIYEGMEPKELEEERLSVIETDEQLQARQRLEDKEEAEMFKIAKMVEAEEGEGGLDKIKLPKENAVITAIKGLSREVNLINDSFGEVRGVEEGIKMVFDETFDESDFDNDSMGLLTNPSKKR